MQFLSQFCRQVGFQDVINVKHSHYKELDINAMNADNKTALQLAAEKGRLTEGFERKQCLYSAYIW